MEPTVFFCAALVYCPTLLVQWPLQMSSGLLAAATPILFQIADGNAEVGPGCDLFLIHIPCQPVTVLLSFGLG